MRIFNLLSNWKQRRMKDIGSQSIGFEYDITAHCNLNCAGCSHYSPVAEKEFVTAEQAERELSRIGAVAGGRCHYIHIMGGEPLLNPDVDAILKIARKNFPIGEIRLVTNGILLMSKPEYFWEAMRENDISLYITEYPVKLPLAKIRTYATVYGIRLKWFRSGCTFSKYSLEPDGRHEIEASFFACPMRSCAQYHEGKLYHCSVTGCVYRLNKAFNCYFEVGDGDYIDVFGDVTVEDIVNFMMKPIPFCRYCNSAEWQENKFPWHVSERKSEEWIKEDTTGK